MDRKRTISAIDACADAVTGLSDQQCAEVIAELLLSAFVWGDESQGHQYWAAVVRNLENLKMRGPCT